MTTPNTTSAARVSVHGGHSKEFGDANDSTLEEIVRAYIDKGFKWVGITEHIPPALRPRRRFTWGRGSWITSRERDRNTKTDWI